MELITDLAAFCSLHHEKDIRIIGSSRSVGKQLIARLQRDGVQTDAVREATVAEVACHLMGETHAAVQGMLSPASAQCVLEAVCRDAGDAAAFFAAEREDAAFHAALLTSFDDCIHAGLDPAALPDQVFSSPEKGTAFRFLAEEFSRTCRVRGSITEAMMLREAATISRPPNT
ncbi:MAG: hypothetical protein JXA28_08930, partial [Bacteroidetes bacterium]|nr:hypothetical protein [Bacteroidota bacterium]